MALVIGNDSYAGSPLSNARNDARSMAQALQRLSFDVTIVENGTRVSIGSAMLAFGRRLTSSDLALVFYAGHGVQVEGVNYLIPVDFEGRTEDEVRLNAVSSDEATRALRRARVGVLVLDACRDNPFSGQRSGGRGLAQLEAQGLLVAFATGAGQTASDGATGNSVFTGELIQVLGSPGRGLRDTFFEVQRRVQNRTEGRQFPAVYSQLVNDVVLTPGTIAALPPAAGDAPSKPSEPPSTLSLQAELALWDAIKDSRSVSAFEDYLSRYPFGQFRVPAEERLRTARASANRPPGVSRPSPMSSRVAGLAKAEIRTDPRIEGVEWARIPAGSFEMGCDRGTSGCADQATPRHSVTITTAFEMMTTELTIAVARALGRPVDRQSPTHGSSFPVVKVGWQEAATTCEALGARLPTEAEWEFAARGGAFGPYPWGADEPVDRDGAPNGARFGNRPVKSVATYQPNAYGLFDMAGNVLELVADWAGPYRADSQSDPKGPDSGTRRVMRGGGTIVRSDLRVSTRFIAELSPLGSDLIGFRCARDLAQ
jgi:formylglycine-generating enzyme required for sulfatase activity